MRNNINERMKVKENLRIKKSVKKARGRESKIKLRVVGAAAAMSHPIVLYFCNEEHTDYIRIS